MAEKTIEEPMVFAVVERDSILSLCPLRIAEQKGWTVKDTGSDPARLALDWLSGAPAKTIE